jgi:sulfur carrier protein ThiS
MKVTVHLSRANKETREVELGEGANVETLVRALGLLPDSWIALRGNDPLPTDEPLSDGDEVRLLSVVSGG